MFKRSWKRIAYLSREYVLFRIPAIMWMTVYIFVRDIIWCASKGLSEMNLRRRVAWACVLCTAFAAIFPVHGSFLAAETGAGIESILTGDDEPGEEQIEEPEVNAEESVGSEEDSAEALDQEPEEVPSSACDPEEVSGEESDVASEGEAAEEPGEVPAEESEEQEPYIFAYGEFISPEDSETYVPEIIEEEVSQENAEGVENDIEEIQYKISPYRYILRIINGGDTAIEKLTVSSAAVRFVFEESKPRGELTIRKHIEPEESIEVGILPIWDKKKLAATDDIFSERDLFFETIKNEDDEETEVRTPMGEIFFDEEGNAIDCFPLDIIPEEEEFPYTIDVYTSDITDMIASYVEAEDDPAVPSSIEEKNGEEADEASETGIDLNEGEEQVNTDSAVEAVPEIIPGASTDAAIAVDVTSDSAVQAADVISDGAVAVETVNSGSVIEAAEEETESGSAVTVEEESLEEDQEDICPDIGLELLEEGIPEEASGDETASEDDGDSAEEQATGAPVEASLAEEVETVSEGAVDVLSDAAIDTVTDAAAEIPDDVIKVTLPTHFDIPLFRSGNGLDVYSEDVTIRNENSEAIDVYIKSVEVDIKQGFLDDEIFNATFETGNYEPYDLEKIAEYTKLQLQTGSSEESMSSFDLSSGKNKDVTCLTLAGAKENTGKNEPAEVSDSTILRLRGRIMDGIYFDGMTCSLKVRVDFDFRPHKETAEPSDEIPSDESEGSPEEAAPITAPETGLEQLAE